MKLGGVTCEKCGCEVTDSQPKIIRNAEVVAHAKCKPEDIRAAADKVDLAIDDWKLSKKY